MNEWVFEGVGVSADKGEERLHFHTSFADLRDGGDGPSSTSVRCGASMALFRGTTPGPMEDLGIAVTRRAGVVVFEARAYDGTLRMRMIVEDEGSLPARGLGCPEGRYALPAEQQRPGRTRSWRSSCWSRGGSGPADRARAGVSLQPVAGLIVCMAKPKLLSGGNP